MDKNQTRQASGNLNSQESPKSYCLDESSTRAAIDQDAQNFNGVTEGITLNNENATDENFIRQRSINNHQSSN